MAWALQPLDGSDAFGGSTEASLIATPPIASKSATPLVASSFERELWRTRATIADVATQEAVPPQAPAPKLSLVAITQDGDQRVASVHDHASTRLVLLRHDQDFQGFTASVGAASLLLERGSERHEYHLGKEGARAR